ncbi:MAG TPA: efflux RND transporter periplasmic adaptor subunit [Thermoanaerobaculia bacterium]|nr:efflux RND transporter periplasmic adaptor subunit [Thermoanaerobaculia bacterium]
MPWTARLRPLLADRRRAAVVVAAAVAVLGGLWLVGPGPSRAARRGESSAQTWVVKRADVRSGVWALGELAAGTSVVVRNRLPGADGRILWIVEDGAEVNEGDVLVRLDSSGFESELVRLESEQAGQKAAMESARQVRLGELARAGQQNAAAASKVAGAKLKLRTVEQGEGPMEERRLEGEFQKAREEERRWSGYVEDLKRVQESGRNVAGELKSASEKLAELTEKSALAKKQLDGYREFVLPGKLEEARAAIGEAEEERRRTEEAGYHAVGRADSEIEKIRAQAAAVDQRLEELRRIITDATIRAPASGLVVLRENHIEGRARKPQVGDRVFQDFPLLELPDPSTMQVRARVRELDLEALRASKAGEVLVEAVPGEVFAAELKQVGALALRREGEDEKYFNVSLSLVRTDARLRPGMTARVFLLRGERRGVLAVPREYLANRGGSFVCQVRDPRGRVAEKPVEPGIEGRVLTEIRSGLREGDVVVAWR